MNSTDNRKFEEEVHDNLHLDDDVILAKRIYSHYDYIRQNHTKSARITSHSRTQWTRIHDGVQEHFSSHVLINGSSYKLPSNIYALKQIAKQSWMLYKKRECERRKRLRVKIEKEREIEAKGGAANILLSMVDACENCKKLFVTVNLFWGTTLCDLCYFNEEVIKEIMKQRKLFVNNDQHNPFQIVEKVLARPSSNDRFFSVNLPDEKINTEQPLSPSTIPSPLCFSLSPDIGPIKTPEIDSHEKDEVPVTDFRPLSTYIPPPLNSDDDEEEIVEEDSQGNRISDSDEPLLFDGYFSQTSFVNPDNFITD